MLSEHMKKNSLPMTVLFQKEKVFFIGCFAVNAAMRETIGGFSQVYYSMWDEKCLA